MCKSSWFHLRALKHIRRSITDETSKSIGHALVSSRLDYANAVHYGTYDKNIKRLQRVQNSLARVVCDTPKLAISSSSRLKELHWLPIKYRITFKLATLAFKCRSNLAPEYLAELVQDYHPSRTLRSSSSNLLIMPHVRTQFGSRGFRVAIPETWNALSDSIRNAQTFPSFKQKLKTHLFDLACKD